jgi:hypothetical protein
MFLKEGRRPVSVDKEGLGVELMKFCFLFKFLILSLSLSLSLSLFLSAIGRDWITF